MATENRICTPLIWPSISRLLATAAIFLFHFQGHYGYNEYHLDFYAILTFCFLSGYLAKVNKEKRSKWFIKRYFGIMVPYWLVIIPVILINEVIGYKDVSCFECFVAISGGNLFLENPIYVIAWYITFILILYTYAFIESFFRSYWKMACLAIALLVFMFALREVYYFILFVLGLRLSEWFPGTVSVNPTPLMQMISSWMFNCQKYCYSFFLAHGGLMLFFIKVVDIAPTFVFINSLCLSILVSILLYNTGKPLRVIAVNKTLQLFHNKKEG